MPTVNPQVTEPSAASLPWLRWLALALLLAGMVAVWVVWRWLGPLPQVQTLDQRQPAPAIYIEDHNGRLLYEIADPARGKYAPVPLDAVPLRCQQAILATEDRHFYQHPGVDWQAILRALWANWRAGETVQGGSTLTQQLARILLLDSNERYERTVRRKLREALLAWQLERRYSKDEILNLYLNNVYFGHYATGIEAAAQAYFGRQVRELDVAQCAMLAGLPQFPAGYNPIEHPRAAKIRQQQVLKLMVEAGMLSAGEAKQAGDEPLHYASTPFPITAPHFVFYVQSQLEAALGRQRLARGGLRVITTLDVDLQVEAERVIRRRLAQLNQPQADLPAQRRAENAALVAMDAHTGEIRAWVGSPDYFDADIAGAVNGALALRQPGSTLKPIAYAVAMDPALSAAAGRQPFTPATVLADVPTSFPARVGLYEPLNYDLVFHGPVPLRYALANSYNIPAVRILQSIGLDAFVAQARRHGINTFAAPERYGLALVLGGAEVRLLELTAAYTPFVHDGRPLSPIVIRRIEDDQGAVLFDAGTQGAPINPAGWDLPTFRLRPPVLDPRTAYLITDILSDNEARSATFGLNSPLRLPRPAAVKTGTTTDWRDNWTIGYTPDLLTGVWVGNADNRPIYGASGVAGAAPIWHDFMIFAHKGLPVHPFVRPPGLESRDICLPSGLLATPDCPRQQRELFIAGTAPTQKDDQFRPITIDLRTGEAATATTPTTARGRRVAWRPPPQLRAWAQDRDMLLWPEATATATGPITPTLEQPSLMIVSPPADARFVLDPRLPAASQQVQLAVAYHGAAPLQRVQFWLDGTLIATAEAPPWQAWWPLQEGRHRLRAVVDTQSGRSLQTEEIVFEVVE